MNINDTHKRVRANHVKRTLKAGEALAFSPVDVLGRKRLSHTIAYRRGRYVVTTADGREVGAFATLARADKAGAAATAEGHSIDCDLAD